MFWNLQKVENRANIYRGLQVLYLQFKFFILESILFFLIFQWTSQELYLKSYLLLNIIRTFLKHIRREIFIKG